MLSNFSKITPDRKKCQVMQVGRKVPDKWNLGEMFIKNTTSYKYHGDVITSDGKNEKNITARENKLHGIVRQINTSASSDVMRGIQNNTPDKIRRTEVEFYLFERNKMIWMTLWDIFTLSGVNYIQV